MGFWGTLAKVGGAVASGIATLPIGGPAWLTPALLAGGGILGSLGHEGGGSKEDQSRINDYLKQLAQMGVISAEQFKQFSDRANIASGETMKFLMGIVQSDPAARADFLAPEINEIGSQYQGALDQISKFGPRGGEQDRAKTMVRTGRSGEVARLLSTSRVRGAELLGDFANQQAGAAQGYGQLTTSAAGTGGQIGTYNRSLSLGQDTNTGNAIGGIIQKILGQKSAGKKGGGGTPVDTSGWFPQVSN